MTDVASWREGGRPAAMSDNMPDDRVQSSDAARSMFADKSCTSVSAANAANTNDQQKQQHMMGNSQHYPPFHGPLPPYMALRPGVKPPAMGPMPFHMGHVPMMPPNFSTMMMSPFVRSLNYVNNIVLS